MKKIIALVLLLPMSVWSADIWKGFAAAEKGDYVTALREWRPLAEQGVAAAQYYLRWMYSNGKGVPQNCQLHL